MYRRKVLKDRIYYLIEKLLGSQDIDKSCNNLEKLGIYPTKLDVLILIIESDFEINLEDIHEDYLEINLVDTLCDCIERELYSQ